MRDEDVRGMRSWANVAKFRRMVRAYARDTAPPKELGQVMTVREAMEALGWTRWRVVSAIREGRLNAWKDEAARRWWVIAEEVEWARTRPGDKETRRQGDKETRPEGEDEGDDEEDGEAWSWDDVCAGQVVEDWAAESEQRYQARLAELMADLEPAGEGNETGRQGEGETEDHETLRQGDPEVGSAQAVGSPCLPVSLSPCLPVSPSPCQPIEAPFPTGWIGTAEAAAMLGWATDYVRQYARNGGLEWRRSENGKRVWVRSVEVEALAERRIWESKVPADLRRGVWGWRRPEQAEEWEKPLISCQEAADLLTISVASMARLARRGRIAAFQEKPGAHGSRLWFSLGLVAQMGRSEQYRERRERFEKGRKTPGVVMAGWEEKDIPESLWSQPGPATRRNYGDYYTTRQVAQILGVSANAVHQLRRSGRLAGCHKKRRLRWQKPGVVEERVQAQWWFYRKEEVEALRENAEYRRRRKRPGR